MKPSRLLLAFLLAPIALPSALLAQTFVDLGSAATFGVLAHTSIVSTGSTVVDRDVGLGLSGSTVSGFADFLPAGPGVVNGTIHFKNTTAAQALVDSTVAYNLLAGQTATVAGVASFANTTLTPGVYNAPASLGLTGDITLDGGGSNNAVFVFQMGSTLLTSIDSRILLTNGAQADRIFWQVGTSATLGIDSVFVGNLLAHTSITANNGASIDGRLHALGGTVTLNTNSITLSATAIPEPATTTLLVAAVLGAIACIRKMRTSRPARETA